MNNINDEINTNSSSNNNNLEENQYNKEDWSNDYEEFEKDDKDKIEEKDNLEEEKNGNINNFNDYNYEEDENISEIKKDENINNLNEDENIEENIEKENLKEINKNKKTKEKLNEIIKIEEPKNYLKIVLMPKIKEEYIKVEDEYDENIIFLHSKSTHEQLDFFKDIFDHENEILPFLSETVFLFEENSTITEDKSMIDQTILSKEELVEIIKKRISNFIKEMQNKNKIYAEYFIKNIPVYVKILNDEDIKYLFTTLNNNIESFDYKLILYLLEKIEEIVKYFNIEGKINLLKDNIIGIIFDHIFKSTFLENSIVKDKIYNLITYLCINTYEETIYLNVLNKIIENSNSEALLIETIRGENFLLIAKLIILLLKSEIKNKEDFCFKFIFPLVKVLYIDKNPRMRQSVCIILPELSNFININIHINELRPLYLLLSNDENSEVRLQAVKILPKLMKDNLEKSHFSEENSFYIKIYSKLIFDNDKKVRATAFQILGDVIYLFTMDDVDKKAKKLIDFFKNNIDQFYFYKDIKYSNVNEDIIYYATLILPTLIYRLGEKNFDSGFNLKEVFLKLCNYNKEKVQKSLL